MITGCKVTLRAKRASYFLEKLVNYAFFKQRNFSGFDFKKHLDYNRLNFGYQDLSCFPETEKLESTFGLNITILTTAKDLESNYRYLTSLEIPINRK